MDTNRFLELFSTRTGRWLSNRLGITGPGSEHLAGLLSNYAWNMRASTYCALASSRALYLNTCEQLRSEIQAHNCWVQVQHRIKFW